MRKSGSEFLRAIITTISEGGIPGLRVQSQEPKLNQREREPLWRCIEGHPARWSDLDVEMLARLGLDLLQKPQSQLMDRFRIDFPDRTAHSAVISRCAQ